MPEYEYLCDSCSTNFSIFYKSLPSEKKQKEAPCPDCDTVGRRLLSPFLAGNTTTGGIQKAMGNNPEQVNIGGRMAPAFRDANGQLREVKSVRDMEHWQKSNQYGAARMVAWKNPKTGETTMEPQRVRMIAGPDGMPLDLPTVKESVPLVPIDDFQMPSETKSGIPLDPKTGTPKIKNVNSLPVPGTRGLIDPSTGKPMTMGSVWGDELSGLGNRQQGKAAISNKHMNKTEAVQRLMSEE
jgi:DNA-directed RNA polymerase subunit RPC12/RpoP